MSDNFQQFFDFGETFHPLPYPQPETFLRSDLENVPSNSSPTERGSGRWSFKALLKNAARVGLKWGFPLGVVSSAIIIGGVNLLQSQNIFFSEAIDLKTAVQFTMGWTALHVYTFGLAGIIDYATGERHF